MNNKITVNKVKYQKTDNKILVEYLIQRNGQFDAVKLLSNEEAEPEFYNALDMLIPSVCEILELPRELFEDRITPLAVALAGSGRRWTCLVLTRRQKWFRSRKRRHGKSKGVGKAAKI